MTNRSITILSYQVLLLVGGIFLYITNLNNFPYSVHCDEILPSLYGLKLIETNFNNMIGVSWFNIPNIVFIPYALSNYIFNPSIFAARFPSAILGTLTILSTYYLAKLLFNKRIAIISSFLLLTSHWWIASSRSGIINIQTVLPEILAFYFLFLHFKKKKLLYIAASGFFTALGLYLYLNSRIIPIIIIIIICYKLLTTSNRFITIKSLLVWLITTLLFFSPMLVFYIKHPSTFLSRTSVAFIFTSNPSTNQHMASIYNSNNRWVWILGNIHKALDISSNYQDNNWQYGYKGHPLEPITLILFVVGQIITLGSIKKIKSFFILLWFWTTYIILGILTVNIALPRLVGLLPVVYLFPAITINKIIKIMQVKLIKQQKFKYLLQAALLTLLITIAYINIKIYFVDNPTNNIPIFAAERTETQLAKYIRKKYKKYNIILLTEPYIPPDWCLLPYLSPKANITSVKPGKKIPNIKGPKIFFILNKYSNKLSLIQSMYPKGNINTSEVQNVLIYITQH